MLRPFSRAEVEFDIIQEIGQHGRNSRTFLAHDHQLNADIVIKQIGKPTLASVANFFDESKALYASTHPNVVQIHYACQDVDNVYIAMPHYQSGSIRQRITGRSMTVREIVIAGCQILNALHNIHSKGLIHFDVKPDNILLSDRGEALLSDFGLAKQTQYGRAVQDRLYLKMMPPESFANDQFDPRFDLYQFGLTLYRMCNGNESFYDQFAAFGAGAGFDRDRFRWDVRNERFPSRDAYEPHIPGRLRRIIKKCLRADPDRRYSAAIEIANAMAEIEGNSLDWRLERNGATKIWSRNKDGTLIRLVVDGAGRADCRKAVGGGNPRRVLAGCKEQITVDEVRELLEETLK